MLVANVLRQSWSVHGWKSGPSFLSSASLLFIQPLKEELVVPRARNRNVAAFSDIEGAWDFNIDVAIDPIGKQCSRPFLVTSLGKTISFSFNHEV